MKEQVNTKKAKCTDLFPKQEYHLFAEPGLKANYTKKELEEQSAVGLRGKLAQYTALFFKDCGSPACLFGFLTFFCLGLFILNVNWWCFSLCGFYILFYQPPEKHSDHGED